MFSLEYLSVRFVLSALLVVGDSSGSSQTPHTNLVASFKSVGQVCLSVEAREKVLESLRTQSLKGRPVVLTGYSDAKELRSGSLELDQCTRKKLPSYISGHERIALLRALHVFEIASDAGIPGFDGEPVFAASLGGTGLRNSSSIVFLSVGRADSSSQTSRGVELTWLSLADEESQGSEDEDDKASETCPCPQPPPKVTVIVPEKPRPPVAEVASYSVGTALLGLGGGFLVAAALQHSQAVTSTDPARRQFLESNEFQYVRAGGWAASVGAGLLVTGITLSIIRRRAQRAKRK